MSEKWQELGYYSAASSRSAQQTKARYARKRAAAEVERLRKLGADEAWIKRVTTGSHSGSTQPTGGPTNR